MDSNDETSKTPKRKSSLLNIAIEALTKIVYSPLAGNYSNTNRNDVDELDTNNDENTNDNNYVEFQPNENEKDISVVTKKIASNEIYTDETPFSQEYLTLSSTATQISENFESTTENPSISQNDDISPLEDNLGNVAGFQEANFSSDNRLKIESDHEDNASFTEDHNEIPLEEYNFFKLKQIAKSLGITLERKDTKLNIIDKIKIASSENFKNVLSASESLLYVTSEKKSHSKSTEVRFQYQTRSFGVKTRHLAIHFPYERSPPSSHHRRTRSSSKRLDDLATTPLMESRKRRKATPYKSTVNSFDNDEDEVSDYKEAPDDDGVDENNEIDDDHDETKNKNINLDSKFSSVDDIAKSDRPTALDDHITESSNMNFVGEDNMVVDNCINESTETVDNQVIGDNFGDDNDNDIIGNKYKDGENVDDNDDVDGNNDDDSDFQKITDTMETENFIVQSKLSSTGEISDASIRQITQNNLLDGNIKDINSINHPSNEDKSIGNENIQNTEVKEGDDVDKYSSYNTTIQEEEANDNDIISANNTVSNYSSHSYDEDTAEENHYADEEDGEEDGEGDEEVDIDDFNDSNKVDKSYYSDEDNRQKINHYNVSEKFGNPHFNNRHNNDSEVIDLIEDEDNDDNDDDSDNNNENCTSEDKVVDDMDVGYLNEENYSDEDNSLSESSHSRQNDIIKSNKPVTTSVLANKIQSKPISSTFPDFSSNNTTIETTLVNSSVVRNEQILTTIPENENSNITSNSPTSILKKAAMDVASNVMSKLSGRLIKVMTGLATTSTPDHDKIRLSEFEYSLFHKLLEESKPLSLIRTDNNETNNEISSKQQIQDKNKEDKIEQTEVKSTADEIKTIHESSTPSATVVGNTSSNVSTPFQSQQLDISIDRKNQLLRRLSGLSNLSVDANSASKPIVDINRPWVPNERSYIGSTPFRPLRSNITESTSHVTPMISILEKRKNESIYDDQSSDQFGPRVKKFQFDKSNFTPSNFNNTNKSTYTAYSQNQNKMLIPQLSGYNPTTDRRASLGSVTYTPAFKDDSLKLASNKTNSELTSLNTLGLGRQRRQSLTFLQRRQLEKQQDNVGSAVVAKRIMESLSELSTPMDEHRNRPKSKTVSWTDRNDSIQTKNDKEYSNSVISEKSNDPIKPKVSFDESANQTKQEDSTFAKPIIQTPYKVPSIAVSSNSSQTQLNKSTKFIDDNDFIFHPAVDVRTSAEISINTNDASSVNFSFSPPNSTVNRIKRIKPSTDSSESLSVTSKTTSITTKESNIDNTTTETIVPKVSSNSNPWSTVSSNKDKIKCEVCLVQNEKSATKCISCESKLVSNESLDKSKDITKPSSIWGLVTDKIKCLTCLVPNEKDAIKCISCETPLGKINETKENNDKLQNKSMSGWDAVPPSLPSGFIFGSTNSSNDIKTQISSNTEGAGHLTSTSTSSKFTGFSFGSNNSNTTTNINNISKTSNDINLNELNKTAPSSLSTLTSSTSQSTSSTPSLPQFPTFGALKPSSTTSIGSFPILPQTSSDSSSSSIAGFTFGSTNNESNKPTAITSGFSFETKKVEQSSHSNTEGNDNDGGRKKKRSIENDDNENDIKRSSSTLTSSTPFQFGNSANTANTSQLVPQTNTSLSSGTVSSSTGFSFGTSSNDSKPVESITKPLNFTTNSQFSFGNPSNLLVESLSSTSTSTTAKTTSTSSSIPSFSLSTTTTIAATPVSFPQFGTSGKLSESVQSSSNIASSVVAPFVFGSSTNVTSLSTSDQSNPFGSTNSSTTNSSTSKNPLVPSITNTNRTASPVELTTQRSNSIPDSPGSTMDMSDSNIGVPVNVNANPASSIGTASTPFSFGSNSQPFSFGSSSLSNVSSAPQFGISSVQKNPFSPSSNSLPAFGNIPSNPFGNSNTSTSFSGFGTSAPSNLGTNNSFVAPPSNTPIFGTTTTTSAPMFGVTSNPPSFGGFGGNNINPINTPFSGGINNNPFPPIPTSGQNAFSMGSTENKGTVKRKILKAKRPGT